jgi:hypothetical protein
MPDGAVYVGRPTKWGNSFAIGAPHPEHGRPMTRDEAIELYEAGIDESFAEAARRELRGRDLVCWCRLDERCHADVLLRVANS